MSKKVKWFVASKPNGNNTVANCKIIRKVKRNGIYNIDLIREALTRTKVMGFGTVEIGFRSGVMFLGQGSNGALVAPMNKHRNKGDEEQ